MLPVMTEDLIRQFRECVNHPARVEKLMQCERNKFSCICSAMDWISMAVESINFYPDVPSSGTCGQTVMDHILLLVRVGLIKEGIEQLHRAIFLTDKPYCNDEKRFDWGIDAMTDNDAFETIRARFGIHPMNQTKSETGERLFSSWPANDGDNGWSVYLYSNQSKQPKVCSFPYGAIEQYAHARYEHLRDLKRELQRRCPIRGKCSLP